jgi:DNA-binding HxlR family transcriptional regulator
MPNPPANARPGQPAIARLIRLGHHRWAIPVLAELARTRGARFVALVNKLEVSRDSLSRTLAALDALGLAGRNPGYGHPLRPEYILTEAGGPTGDWAVKLVSAIGTGALEEAMLKKWSCATLVAMAAGARRFVDLRDRLPEVTARALTLTLKQLQGFGLIQRRVIDAYPPRTEYVPAARGLGIAQLCIEVPVFEL